MQLNERRTKRRYDRPSSSNAPPPVFDRDPCWPRKREGEPIETRENYTDPNEAVRHKDCTHRPITKTGTTMTALTSKGSRTLSTCAASSPPFLDSQISGDTWLLVTSTQAQPLRPTSAAPPRAISSSLEFHPDPLLLRNLANIPRRRPTPRAARAVAQPQPEIPDFPHIPDILMHDHGDFQHVVVDALHAIWAKESQCR
ncbi:hypothetical protein F2Q69_00022822 [Brassica cretica]|uniref:Uncharacterized protein n=1 Tax=Brassica cretica TaxID=69181 RepID=A0A8S9QV47_BRACR|nr:hypothetical protein F2Q69_00022822 [Brassica cretica]